MGKNSAESIRIENVRKQLRVGKTRGGLDLTPEQIEDLNRQLNDYKAGLKTRIAARVNAHTTTEVDRTIATVNNHMAGVVAEAVVQVKGCFKESFCPEVSGTAPAKERLDALKARHSIERGLMVQLLSLIHI